MNMYDDFDDSDRRHEDEWIEDALAAEDRLIDPAALRVAELGSEERELAAYRLEEYGESEPCTFGSTCACNLSRLFGFS